jgi:hypothetical protein
MHVNSLDLFFWAAGFWGEVLLLGVLWQRGRAAAFPVFTTYIGFSVARTIYLYLVMPRLGLRGYEVSYWWLGVIDELLQLLVAYEVAMHVFRPTGVWAPDVWRTFLGMAALGVTVAGVLTRLDVPATTDPVQADFYRANFFSAVLMSELFVGMLALSVNVGLPWKTHAARIAQGLGVYSVVCVGIGIASTMLGIRHAIRVSEELAHVRMTVFTLCEAYWIAMLWQSAPAPRELPEEMRTQIYVLQRRVEYDLNRLRGWGRRS